MFRLLFIDDWQAARRGCDTSSPPVLTTFLMTNALQLHAMHVVLGCLQHFPVHMNGSQLAGLLSSPFATCFCKPGLRHVNTPVHCHCSKGGCNWGGGAKIAAQPFLPPQPHMSKLSLTVSKRLSKECCWFWNILFKIPSELLTK